MKIISPAAHGIIDYAVVVFLLASPMLFGLTGFPATFAYALGGIHLLLTVLTDFHYGLVKVIPFRVHGLIELLVGILLIASPWIFGFNDDATAQYFFMFFAIAVLVVWLLTNYQAKPVVT